MANYTSAGLAASIVIPAQPAGVGPYMLNILRGFAVHSTKTTAQYIQIHDAAALPSNGAIPLMTYPVEANAGVYADYGRGRQFSNGMVICNSSTAATLTVGGADCLIDAQTRLNWWE